MSALGYLSLFCVLSMEVIDEVVQVRDNSSGIRHFSTDPLGQWEVGSRMSIQLAIGLTMLLCIGRVVKACAGLGEACGSPHPFTPE